MLAARQARCLWSWPSCCFLRRQRHRCDDVQVRWCSLPLARRSSCAALLLSLRIVRPVNLSSCPEVARLSPARNHTAAWFELLWCLLTAFLVPRCSFLASSRWCLCSGVLFSDSLGRSLSGCLSGCLRPAPSCLFRPAITPPYSHARAIWAFELIMRLCSCGAPCTADLVLCFSCADLCIAGIAQPSCWPLFPCRFPPFSFVSLTGAYARWSLSFVLLIAYNILVMIACNSADNSARFIPDRWYLFVRIDLSFCPVVLILHYGCDWMRLLLFSSIPIQNIPLFLIAGIDLYESTYHSAI